MEMMRARLVLWVPLMMMLVVLVVALGKPALADDLRPAYLQISETSPNHFDVVWKVPTNGGYSRVPIDVRFDNGVTSTGERLSRFDGSAYTESWRIISADQIENTRVTIDGLARATTEVLMRIEYQDGTSATHRFTPDAPDHVIAGKPSWSETAMTYFILGVEHILFGFDHLLFVFALLLLIRGFTKLVATVTAFTVAHSITLILAALGLFRIPIPPVEACIALSIMFVAVEIIHGLQGREGIAVRRPWIVAFAFGLLHGVGFAAALGEIGLPENAIATALVVFNLGVEAGQLLFVVGVLAVWHLIGKRFAYPWWAMRIPAYAIGSLAAFWVVERVSSFWV